MATSSRARSNEGACELGDRFTVFDPIGQDPESQNFNLSESLLFGAPITQRSWYERNLRYPAAIGFLIELDRELGHILAG
jgi:hypothetical protein